VVVVVVVVCLWERSHLVAVVRLRRPALFPSELVRVVAEVGLTMVWVVSGSGNDDDGGGASPVVPSPRASSARCSHSERATSSWMAGTRMRR
jgi:hypothetical protein